MDLPKLDSIVVTHADMSHCPLCLDKWAMYEESGANGKVYFHCIKSKCMISIWVRDPLLGRYFYTESEQCPVCAKEKMRMFYRSDGYIKMVCGKCGAAIESVDSDKHAALMKKEQAEGKRKTFSAEPEPEVGP